MQNYCHITCSCSSCSASPSNPRVDFLQDLSPKILFVPLDHHLAIIISIKPICNLVWTVNCHILILRANWLLLLRGCDYTCVCLLCFYFLCHFNIPCDWGEFVFSLIMVANRLQMHSKEAQWERYLPFMCTCRRYQGSIAVTVLWKVHIYFGRCLKGMNFYFCIICGYKSLCSQNKAESKHSPLLHMQPVIWVIRPAVKQQTKLWAVAVATK